MSDKKKNRRAYLDDFSRNASGEYIYTGALYARKDGMTRSAQLLRLWVSGGILAASVAARGCIPAAGMVNCFYVLIPYIGELICTVSVIWAIIRQTANKEPLREYVYNATVCVLPVRAAFSTGFAAAAFVGEIVYFAIHGFDAAVLAFLHILAVASGLTVRRFSQLQTWEKTEKM